MLILPAANWTSQGCSTGLGSSRLLDICRKHEAEVDGNVRGENTILQVQEDISGQWWPRATTGSKDPVEG